MNAPVLQVPSTTQVSALRLWMKGFYWLIKREFWEHQRRLVWMPAMLGVLSVALGVLSFLLQDLKLFVDPLSEQRTDQFGTIVAVQMAAIVGQQLLASLTPVVLLFVVLFDFYPSEIPLEILGLSLGRNLLVQSSLITLFALLLCPIQLVCWHLRHF